MKQGGRDRWRCFFSGEDAGLLELAQPVGEQVRRDSGQPVAQVRVATCPLQRQLADDQQRPAIADDVERLRHSAVLIVGPHRIYFSIGWKNECLYLTFLSRQFRTASGCLSAPP